MNTSRLVSQFDSNAQKRVLRSVVGRRYDNLYYNIDSSSVEIIENSACCGRYKVNLSSPSYGAMSTIQIPNTGSFVGKCYLHLEIPAPADGNWALTRAWGLALIQSVELLYPNSNIQSTKVDRTAIWHSLYSSCNDSVQLDNYMRLAGEAFNGEALVQDKIEGKFIADIVLDLPFSNYASGKNSKKYFDTSLVMAPFQVNVAFNDFRSIWGNTYVPPSNNFTAQFFYRQLDLSNTNDSLKNELFSTPGMSLTYPSLYRQSFPVNFVAPAAPALATDPATVVELNLQSFINADVLSIDLSCHLRSEITPTVANSPVSPWNALPIYDLEFKFGGSVIYSVPRWAYRLVNQEGNSGGLYLPNDIQNNPTGVAGATINGPVKNYIIQIDMSRLRAGLDTSDFPNTIRFTSQTLQISFRVPSNYVIPGTTNTVVPIAGQSCVLLATYYYPQVTIINDSSAINVFYS